MSFAFYFIFNLLNGPLLLSIILHFGFCSYYYFKLKKESLPLKINFNIIVSFLSAYPEIIIIHSPIYSPLEKNMNEANEQRNSVVKLRNF